MASSAAPPPLDLVQRFLNTAELDSGVDDLATADGLAAWLDGEGFGDPGEPPPDPPALARVHAVREGLRALALANAGGTADPEAVAALNAETDHLRLRPTFSCDDASCRFEPQGTAVDAALSRIVAVVVESMAAGTWRRLKACRRHSCRWAFYDTSRNQSRTWCSMATCGNRTKAERFRSRGVHSH